MSARAFQWPVLLRLVVALLLGLQFGLLAFYQPSSTGWIWVPWLPLVILLSALVVSIWRDPQVRRREVDAERVLRGLMRFALILIAVILVAFIAFLFIRSIGALVLALIPLVLGVVTAFTLMGNRHPSLAIVCGLLTWLGVGGPFLFSNYLTSRQPGNPFGDLVFILLIFGVLTGFLFAALGGFLGRLLRLWVLG